MAADKSGKKINGLLAQSEFAKARELIERELHDEPTNHWLLTQLGVTHYEQRRYAKALEIFERSRKILPSCPLTRWNLAGALDALGRSDEAVKIYRALIRSKVTADEDPCWEGKRWSDEMKANCVYRAGISYGKLGQYQRAERCLRQYVQLLMAGIKGAYPIDEVMCDLASLRRSASDSAKISAALQKAVDDAFDAAVRC